MKAVLISLASLFLLPGATLAANPLTPAEVRVCQTLKQCLSIVKRHGEHSFDYTVLRDEFARYDRRGRAELIRMMERDADARSHAADLLAQIAAPDTLTHLSPLAQSGDADLSALSSRTIESIVMRLPDAAELPAEALPGLLITAQRQPSLAVLRRLLRMPDAPLMRLLPGQLMSDDPAVTRLAYETLDRMDPPSAASALRSAVRRTDRLGQALALGETMANLASEADGQRYAGLLRAMWTDDTLSQPMRDGILYGRLLLDEHEPIRPNPDMDALMRLDAILRSQGRSLPQAGLDLSIRRTFQAQTHHYPIRLHKENGHCDAGRELDPAARINRLPFFELTMTLDGARPSAQLSMPSRTATERAHLKAALGLAGGWLAAYDNGREGSLIWYRNADSQPTVLLGGRPITIFSKQAQSMGRLPTQAWTISARPDGMAELFSIEAHDMEQTPTLRRKTFLPAMPNRYARLPDDQLLLSWDDHRPLLIAPDGSLQRECPDVQSIVSGLSLVGGDDKAEPK